MTYDEYKNIHKEWVETDSLNRKKEIEGIIFNTAYDLFRRLHEVYKKRGKKYVQDNEYSEVRGHYTLDTEDLDWDGDNVHLRYEDSWAYGGYCDITITVPMKYLDEGKLAELDHQLLESHIEELRKKIDDSNAGIRQLEEYKIMCCNELNSCNKELCKLKEVQEEG